MARSVLFAFDKFRGTATSLELAAAATSAAETAGWLSHSIAVADGGEGSLDVLGGPNKRMKVTGPLGRPVEAEWRLEGKEAFIEMASASGLALAGGAEGNDPLLADTTGTGQLIAQAVGLGARTVVVMLGGSATTDGGLGAINAMPNRGRLKEIELIVACDVETRFRDAARVFGPQKGASTAQVELLTRRLEQLERKYLEDYGVDVSEMSGAGAAGGLAGGLVAVGGHIESGFDILADRAGLDEYLATIDLVVTGEGYLDPGSFHGKVVGGVHRWASAQGVPTIAVVGDTATGVDLPAGLEVRSLVDRYGEERSFDDTLRLVAEQVTDVLASRMID